MIDRSCLQKREILQLNSICPVAAGTKEGYSICFLVICRRSVRARVDIRWLRAVFLSGDE